MTCRFRPCDRLAVERYMCKSHAQRERAKAAIYCNCGELIPFRSSSGSKFSGELCEGCKGKRVCSSINCKLPVLQKSLCKFHYRQMWRNGSLTPICKKCSTPLSGSDFRKKYCDGCRLENRRISNRVSESNRRGRVGAEALSRKDLDRLKKLSNGKCYLCTEGLDGEIELDHILPVCMGGRTMIENLALTHKSCNRRKGGRLPDSIDNLFPKMILPGRYHGSKNV